MTFKIIGLSAQPFRDLYGLSDAALAARNAKRYIADTHPGYPDRIELRDVEIGEPVILVNHTHQAGNTPFHSSHAVFVREGAQEPRIAVDAIPKVLEVRPISARAFTPEHWMIDAELCAGDELAPVIERLLSNRDVGYVQLHFAKRGCYAARAERA